MLIIWNFLIRKNNCIAYVNEDVLKRGVNAAMAADRAKWKIRCADPTTWDMGRNKKNTMELLKSDEQRH